MAAKKVVKLASVAALLAVAGVLSWVSVRQRGIRRRLESDNLRLRAEIARSGAGDATSSAPEVDSREVPGSRLASVAQKMKALRDEKPDELPTVVAHPLDNRGFTEVLDACETLDWAMERGDIELLQKCLYFDPAARAEVEALRATLTVEQQAKYPTPESLFALYQAYHAIAHPGPNSEDYFVDTPGPEILSADDQRMFNGMVFHHTPEGWKWRVPAGSIKWSLSEFLAGGDP